jgi:oligopeptide transport system ATP-binding protein
MNGLPSISPEMTLPLDTLLDVQDLNIAYQSEDGNYLAVKNASFSLTRGEVLGLVGESGCGKSTLGLGLLRLLRWPGKVVSGQALFQGKDLFKLSDREIRTLRGDRLAMIFQNPMNSLNPTEPIGAQIRETITTHRKMESADVKKRAIELLDLVGIPGSKLRVNDFPHEFSGGMRQRALIALALALEPDLLVADDPTTALDLTIQGQILWLLENIQKRSKMTMIYITHNLAVASSISHRIAVMYLGWIVEVAQAEELFTHPAHPYAIGLISSVPKAYWKEQRVTAIPGQPPRLQLHEKGCPFAPRCSRETDICREEMPPMTEIDVRHSVRCFHAF